MNIIANISTSFFNFIISPTIRLVTNPRILIKFLFTLTFIFLIYLFIAFIYCTIFKYSTYFKFFKNTFIPIIGLIITIIQGIITVFFIPYNMFIILIQTFDYFGNIIKTFFWWLYDFIYKVVNIEDELLKI